MLSDFIWYQKDLELYVFYVVFCCCCCFVFPLFLYTNRQFKTVGFQGQKWSKKIQSSDLNNFWNYSAYTIHYFSSTESQIPINEENSPSFFPSAQSRSSSKDWMHTGLDIVWIRLLEIFQILINQIPEMGRG